MPVRANRTEFLGSRVSGVELFVLENNEAKSGPVRVTCSNFGATLTGVVVLVGDERRQVCLGYDNAQEYLANPSFYGSTVGPVANRVADASIKIEGRTHKLEKNDGKNSLHSGPSAGFGKKHFSTETFTSDGVGGLHFKYVHPAGLGGFPAELQVSVFYILTDENELIFHYRVTSDAAGPVNMTNHAYWNLAGEGAGSIDEHLLQINAAQILENGPGLIPTGKFIEVGNVPAYDFRKAKRIGQDMDYFAGRDPAGYDDCYILDSDRYWSAGAKLTSAALTQDGLQGMVAARNTIREAAVVSVPDLRMEVFTDQEAVQFYSGIGLAEANSRSGKALGPGAAFCLETQGYNDAVHNPQFPNWILQPGFAYSRTTVHAFTSR